MVKHKTGLEWEGSVLKIGAFIAKVWNFSNKGKNFWSSSIKVKNEYIHSDWFKTEEEAKNDCEKWLYKQMQDMTNGLKTPLSSKREREKKE